MRLSSGRADRLLETIQAAFPARMMSAFGRLRRQKIMGQNQPGCVTQIFENHRYKGFGILAAASLTPLPIQNPGKNQFCGWIDFPVLTALDNGPAVGLPDGKFLSAADSEIHLGRYVCDIPWSKPFYQYIRIGPGLKDPFSGCFEIAGQGQ